MRDSEYIQIQTETRACATKRPCNESKSKDSSSQIFGYSSNDRFGNWQCMKHLPQQRIILAGHNRTSISYMPLKFDHAVATRKCRGRAQHHDKSRFACHLITWYKAAVQSGRNTHLINGNSHFHIPRDWCG